MLLDIFSIIGKREKIVRILKAIRSKNPGDFPIVTEIKSENISSASLINKKLDPKTDELALYLRRTTRTRCKSDAFHVAVNTPILLVSFRRASNIEAKQRFDNAEQSIIY